MIDTIIRKYLETRGSTLWARSFDIQSEDGRIEAADFIEHLLADLGDLMDKHILGECVANTRAEQS